jgi:hypothetical protein
VIEFFDADTLTGAREIVGVDARMNVVLTENAPSPFVDVAYTLYWTSAVVDIPVCV